MTLTDAQPEADIRDIRGRIALLVGLDEARLTDGTAVTDLVEESIGFVELVLDLEEEFGVRFVQADLVLMDTVGDLARLIRDRVDESADIQVEGRTGGALVLTPA